MFVQKNLHLTTFSQTELSIEVQRIMTELKQIDNGTVELSNGTILGRQWKVVRKLGEGGCGSVFLVKNLTDNTEAALKAESNFASAGCVLKLEVAILKRLEGKPHVAQYMGSARLDGFSYFVMTLLGDTLHKLFRRLRGKITVSTQTRIAANILFCVKQIHDIGFIHRDLKPANIALGHPNNLEESRFFHILDFGLARQYAIPDVKNPSRLVMRRPRERACFRGTTRYCSIRMHDRAEQGRVDDLWSMLYMLAELRGPLPWARTNDKRVVGEMKRLYTDKEVLQNSPQEFLEIAKHLRSLTYFHRPDYKKIFKLLMTVMRKGCFTWKSSFDWEHKPTMTAVAKVEKEKEKESDSDQKGKRESAEASGSGEKASGSGENEEEEKFLLPFESSFFSSDPIGF